MFRQRGSQSEPRSGQMFIDIDPHGIGGELQTGIDPSETAETSRTDEYDPEFPPVLRGMGREGFDEGGPRSRIQGKRRLEAGSLLQLSAARRWPVGVEYFGSHVDPNSYRSRLCHNSELPKSHPSVGPCTSLRGDPRLIFSMAVCCVSRFCGCQLTISDSLDNTPDT